MKLFLFTIFMLASVVSNGYAQVKSSNKAPKSCYMLNDPDAPFYSLTAKFLLDNNPEAQIALQDIHKQSPQLSKCLASNDIVETLLPVYFADESQKCLNILKGEENGSDMMDGSFFNSESRRLQLQLMGDWIKKFINMFDWKFTTKDDSGSMERRSEESGSGETIDDIMEKAKHVFPMLDELWLGGKMGDLDGLKKNLVLTEEQKTLYATTLCPLIDSMVMPCVKSLLLPAIESILVASDSCCHGFELSFEEWMGSRLQPFIKSMSKTMQASVCSTNSMTGVVCGDAWTTYMYELQNSIQGMSNMGIDGDKSAIEMMLQLPNSEVCNAMTGKSFQITSGVKCMNKVDSTVDICYKPFNNLMTSIANLPMIEKMNLTSMFNDGDCMYSEKLYNQFNISMKTNSTENQNSYLGMLMQGLSPNSANNEPKNMCFHIPNSVNSCVFSNALSSDDFGSEFGSEFDDNDATNDDYSSAISVMVTNSVLAAAATIISATIVIG